MIDVSLLTIRELHSLRAAIEVELMERRYKLSQREAPDKDFEAALGESRR